MNRRRLLGISCALVALTLSLVPAAPSAHAQLPPPPPLPGVNLAPVVTAGLDQVITLPVPQMLLPFIVEMQPPLPPLLGQANVSRALEALDLLRLYGIPVAGLSLIDGAAGFANAAGISAVSLVPTVTFIYHDATVGPRPSAEPPAIAPPDQLSEAYPRVV